jgi:hypothetical protein
LGLHLVKLCVGCDTVDELLAWREASRQPGKPWILRTRQIPRRAEALLDGGSLYRVFKGFILSRQRIIAVDGVGEGASRRCEITLSEDVVLVAPPDLGADPGDVALPPDLARTLREIGAW